MPAWLHSPVIKLGAISLHMPTHSCPEMQVQQDHVLVIYDDLDLPTAKTRLRAKGGHGGHNGMRSIVAMLGNSQDFARIRVGAALLW
jgi:peptidyl-tRNA hydrolase